MNAVLILVKMEEIVKMKSMNTTVDVYQDTQELIVKPTLMNAVLIHVKMEQHVKIKSMDTFVAV